MHDCCPANVIEVGLAHDADATDIRGLLAGGVGASCRAALWAAEGKWTALVRRGLDALFLLDALRRARGRGAGRRDGLVSVHRPGGAVSHEHHGLPNDERVGVETDEEAREAIERLALSARTPLTAGFNWVVLP